MNAVVKIILVGFLLRAILAFVAWHPDLNNHIDWGIRFWQYGPAEFYKANVWNFTWPNQPPGTIYIFAFIRKLYELIFSLFWFLNINIPLFPSNIMLFFEERLYPALLKLPSMLADLGIAYLIYKFFLERKKEALGLFASLLFLFNPVTWYNSSVWGQTDSIINFFALLAFILLFKNRFILATLSLAISFYIKASLLIFLPVFLLILFKKQSFVGSVKSLGIAVAALALLSLPFSQGNPIVWLFNLYPDKVFGQQLQVITANAFNIWAFLAGTHERPHSLLLGPLSYAWWGRILFGVFFFPSLYLVWRRQEPKLVFLSLSIIAFSSFIFLTNMHERYLYPLFPVFTILAVLEKRLLSIYIAVSALHLLNLYNLWWYPRIEFLVGILSSGDRFLPRILGAVNTLLFLWLYFSFFKKRTDAG